MSRIMVVDDEGSVRTLLMTLLTQKGYEVAGAASGPLALAKCISFHPHLVLLDINMPGMSGLETLKKLKDLNPNLLVIMVTGLDDEEVARVATEAGACDYITKPISLAQLETHLAVHLFMEE